MSNLIFIVYLGALSIGVPIVMGLSNYQFLKIDQKIILSFLIIGGGFDLILYFTSIRNMHNYVFVHIFTLVEFAFISAFYTINLKQYIKLNYLLAFNSIIFIFLFSISFIFDSTSVFDSFSISIEYLVFIGFSFLLIFNNSFSNEQGTTYKTSIILNYIFLFYYSISFFIFLFGNLLNAELIKNVWIINSTITLVSNLLIAFALWKARQQMKF